MVVGSVIHIPMIRCVTVAQYLASIIGCEETLAYGPESAAVMTTKLNQKLLEDLRLQKRILAITENEDSCINPKQLNGPNGFPSSAEIAQPYRSKRSIDPRANSIAREAREADGYAIVFDDEYHDRRNSFSTVSALNKTRRRSHVTEESGKQYNETYTKSKAYQDLPFYYHYNNISDRNSISNRRVAFKGIGSSSSSNHSAHDHGVGGMAITSTSRGSGGGGGYAVSNSIRQLELPNYNYHNQGIKRISHRHLSRRSSFDLGEIDLQQQYFSDSDHNVVQARSYLQLREISRDAEKLTDVLKLNSNLTSDGLIKSKKASDVGRDLLRGAMDLEESLRMLAKLQKAARSVKIVDEQGRHSVDRLPKEFMAVPNNSNPRVLQFEEPRHSYDGSSYPKNYHVKGRLKDSRLYSDGSKESIVGTKTRTRSSSVDLREAIKSSLSRQKLLYNNHNSSAVQNFDDDDDDMEIKYSDSKPASSNANQQDGKRRIPNVIARLMGLEELPVETSPKATNAGNSQNSKVPNFQARDLHLALPGPVNTDVVKTSSISRDQGSAKGSRPDQQLQASNLRQKDSKKKPTLTERESVQTDQASMKPKDQFQETIKAALDRVKSQAQKPSVKFELLEKNRGSRQVGVDQERKTLKQILEAMQIKGILHPQSSDNGPLHESSINANLMASKSHSDQDNFRAKQKPARTKIQQDQQQYVQGRNTPEITSANHETKRNSNADKIASRTAPIVIMKPVPAKLPSPKIKQSQLHDHKTESASRKSKQTQGINTVKTISTTGSPSKKKLGKGTLGITPDDGQSKKNNSNSGSHRGSKHARAVIDHGGHQKQLKPHPVPHPSSSPPPLPVLQELQRRRNERNSRTNSKPVDLNSSPSTKQEEEELVQTDSSNHVEKSVSVVTKPGPVSVSGSTDNSSWDMQHESDEKLPKAPKSAQSHDALTTKTEEEEEEDQESSISTESGSHQAEAVIPPVANLERTSEEEDTTHCESQVAGQHKSIGDHAPPSISSISAPEMPPEVDHKDENEDAEPSGHINPKDSGYVQTDISSRPIPEPSHEELSDNIIQEGFDNVNAKSTELGEEYKPELQADYVRQILMNNPTLANSGGEPIELYPQLYCKLEEQEAAMYSFSHDNIKRRVRYADDDHENIERRLVFDCVKELLKRKARRLIQMKQPTFTRMRISLGMKRKSMEELVKELSEDIGELTAYHVVSSWDKYDPSDEKFGSDSLYTMLKRDLNLRPDVNAMWGSSWDNGMFGEEEAHEIGRDIEKVILDELLEDIILDQVMVL